MQPLGQTPDGGGLPGRRSEGEEGGGGLHEAPDEARQGQEVRGNVSHS